MSQAVMAIIKPVRMAFLVVLAALTVAAGPAAADPCAVTCRSQHNNCRMTAKLLYSPRCDDQLQACISQCFSAGRFNRDAIGERGRGGEFRERRGPPEMREPPVMRGSPRELHDFRDQRAPRWLGGGGLWNRR
ncbi:MAG: hypothetical protein ABW006_08350 [Hyphomicrobium sp.]